MKKVPYGKSDYGWKNTRTLCKIEWCRFYKPITAGIFVSIVANGELNAKYPNGIEAQKEKLEAEGHTIIQKGRKNIRYYVKDYENF